MVKLNRRIIQQKRRLREEKFYADMRQRILLIKSMVKVGRERTRIQNNLMQTKDDYQLMVFQNQQEQLVGLLRTLSPRLIAEIVLTQTSMRTRLLIDIINAYKLKLLEFVNVQFGKIDDLTQLFEFYGENQLIRMTQIVLKTIVQIGNRKDYSYLQILFKQFTTSKSLFASIFKNSNIFALFDALSLQPKDPIKIVEYIIIILEYYNKKEQVQLFFNRLSQLKIENAWKKNIFQNISSQNFTLKELNYNCLHHLSNQKNFEQFMLCLKQDKMSLVNQFNIAGQTPLDICFRKFSFQQIDQLLIYMKNNPKIKLTDSCINKLLDNKNLLDQNKLLLIIKQLKQLSQIGLNSYSIGHKMTVKVNEVVGQQYLLAKQDSYGEYPLLKYIRSHKYHTQELINQLIFLELRDGLNYLQNNIVQRVVSQRIEKIDLIRTWKMPRQIQRQLFNATNTSHTKLQQLLFSALKHSKSTFETILDYLLKDTKQQINVCHLFISNQGKIRDFSSHLLIILMDRGILDTLVEKLIHQLFNTTKVKFENIRIIKKQMFKKNIQDSILEQINSDINLINELLYQFVHLSKSRFHNHQTISQKQTTKNYINLLKQYLVKYYRSNKEQLFNFVIRNNKRIYIATIADYFFSTEQIKSIIKEVNTNLIKDNLIDGFITQKPELVQSIILSPNKSKFQQYVQNILNVTEDPVRKAYLIKLFILSFKNKYQSLNYFANVVFHQNIIKETINTLFANEEIKAINYLQNKRQYQYLIVEKTMKQVNEHSFGFVDSILKHRQNSIFIIEQAITLPRFRLKDPNNFIETAIKYGEIGVDSVILIPLRYKLNKIVESADISLFLKNVFYIMIKQDKSFLQSVLASDDFYIDQVKVFFDIDLCLFKFYKLDKMSVSAPQTFCCQKLKQKLKANYTLPFIFQIQHQRCNYLICKKLQTQLSKHGVFRKDIKYSQSKIFLILKSFIQLKIKKNKYNKYEPINYGCFENPQFGDKIFERVFPSYYQQKLYLQKGAQQTHQNSMRSQSFLQVINLFDKLRMKSIELVQPQQYLMLGEQYLHLVRCCVPIFGLQKINNILKHATLDEIIQQEKEMYIKFLLQTIIRFETNGQNYRISMKYLQKHQTQQQNKNLRLYCLKQLIIYHPKIAYKHLVQEIPNLTLDQFCELNKIARFKGYPPLVLTLQFIITFRSYYFCLIDESTRIAINTDSYFPCSLSFKHFELYLDCALEVINRSQKYLKNFQNICIKLAPSLSSDKLDLLLSKIINHKHSFVLLSLIVENVFSTKSKFWHNENKYLFKNKKILLNSESYQNQLKVLDKIYFEFKKITKSLKNFDLLKSLFIFKESTLLDFNPISITFIQFLELIQINIGAKGLIQYFQKIVSSKKENLPITKQIINIRKSILQKLHSWGLGNTSYEQIQTVCQCIKVIKTFSVEEDFQVFMSYPFRTTLMFYYSHPSVSSLAKQFQIGFQSDLVACSIVKFQTIPKEDLINGRGKYHFILHGQRCNVLKYIQYFDKEDLRAIIVNCNDIVILKAFLNRFFDGKLQKQQSIFRALHTASQKYIIDLFNSYSHLFQWIIKMQDYNIFQIIIFRRWIQFFGVILDWSEKNSISITCKLQETLEQATQNNFYQYQMISPSILPISQQSSTSFESSIRFINNQQIQNTLKISCLTPESRRKLQYLLKIKKLIAKQHFSGAKKIDYSIRIHKILLHSIFNFIHYQSPNIHKNPEIGLTISNIITGTYTLTHHFQFEQIQFKNTFIGLLCFYFTITDKGILKNFKASYPYETEIIKLLFQHFGQNLSQYKWVNKQFPIVLLNKYFPSDNKLIEFLFTNYSKQIIEQAFLDQIKYAYPKIHLLLLDFNNLIRNDQHKVKYLTVMEHILVNNLTKFKQVNIINWCCFPFLQLKLNQLIGIIGYERSQMVSQILEYVRVVKPDSLEDENQKISIKHQLRQIISYLPKSLSLSQQFVQYLQHHLLKVQCKCYKRLSLISIYLYLTETITLVQQKTKKYFPNIIIHLSLNQITISNIITRTIKCRTQLFIDDILFIKSELMYQMRTKCSEIQIMMYPRKRQTYINSRINQILLKSIKQHLYKYPDELSKLSIKVNTQSFQSVQTINDVEQIFCFNKYLRDTYSIVHFKQTFLKNIKGQYLTTNGKHNNKQYNQAPDNIYNTESQMFIFPQIYGLIEFSNRNVEMQYINNQQFEQLEKSQNKLVLDDIRRYYRQFKSKTIHNKNEEKFNSKVYYTAVEGKIKASTLKYSLLNIMQVFSKFDCFWENVIFDEIFKMIDEKKLELFDSQQDTFIDALISFNVCSFTKFAAELCHQQFGVFETIDSILKNSTLVYLIKSILMQFATEASKHFLKQFKGIRIQNKLVSPLNSGIVIFNNPSWIVHQISYNLSKSKQYLIINLHSSVNKEVDQCTRWSYEVTPNQTIEQFVSNYDFFNPIGKIDQNTVRRYLKSEIIQQQLSKLLIQLQKSHDDQISQIVIDYKSLVEIMGDYSNKHIGLKRHLQILGQTLISNIKHKLEQDYCYSERHYILLMQKINSFKETQLPKQNQLRYSYNNKSHLHHLKGISFSFQILQRISNRFLIHISSSFVLKNLILNKKYLVGMKNNTIIFIDKMVKWNGVDKSTVKWVLLVTKQLPNQNLIPRSQLKSVSVVTGNNSLCLIDGLLEYLYQKKLNYNQLFPVLPKKIKIVFSDNKNIVACNTDPNIMYYLYQDTFQGFLKDLPKPSYTCSQLLEQQLKPIVFSFIQNIKLKTQVIIDFHQLSLNEKIKQIILDKMQLFEKVFQKVKDSPRLQCMDQALSVIYPGINLKQNWMVSKKSQIISLFVKNIRFVLLNQQKVFEIDNDQLRISISSEDYFISLQNISRQFQECIVQRYKQYLRKLFLFNHEETFTLNQLIFCEVQYSIVSFVQKIHPQIKFSIKKSNKKQVLTQNHNTAILFNHEGIVPFVQIIGSIINIPHNNKIIEYDGQSIQLNGKWQIVQKVIVINRDSASKNYIQFIKHQKTMTHFVNIKLPNNSVYIVIGSFVSWNTTHLNTKFQNKINSTTQTPINVFVNIETKQKQVKSLDQYEFNCLVFNPYSKEKQQSQKLLQLADEVVLITRNIIKVIFFRTKIDSIIIRASQQTQSCLLKHFYPIRIRIESSNPICIQNTVYVGVIPLVESHNLLRSEIDRFKNSHELKKIVPTQNKRKEKKVFFQSEPVFESSHHSSLKKQEIVEECLKNQSPFECSKQQFEYLSKAGNQRIDIISMRDKNNNPIAVYIQKISFRYVNNPILEIEPDIEIVEQKCEKYNQCYTRQLLYLKWKPLIRGRYNLIINGMIINTDHQIAVSANELDQNRLTIQKQNIESSDHSTLIYQEMIKYDKEYTINYETPVRLNIRCRDIYGNIFGESQNSYSSKLKKLIEITCEDLGFKCQVSKISPEGNMKIQFKISKTNFGMQKEIQVNLLYKRKCFRTMKFIVSGKSLSERRLMFQHNLLSYDQNRKRNIAIRRQHFFQDLMTHVKENLNTIFSVSFTGENGIDAGGLKRQFYDNIGQVMKNKNERFFTPIFGQRQKYMLSNKLLEDKNKQTIFRCFGKFLANSILNGYLIGIQFVQSFVKVLYQQQIKPQDLKFIMSERQFKNYEDLLLYTASQLQSLQMTFVDNETGQEIKADGKNIPLTTKNVQQYLQCIAKYKIHTKYRTVYDAFKSGFNEVFPWSLIERYFQPSEFFTLTSGSSWITPSLIIELLTFYPANLVQNDWMIEYISKSKQNNLKRFLKYVTGSTSLPYDPKQKNIKLSVQFYSIDQAKKSELSKLEHLPVAHTCMLMVRAPQYKSYDILKQKFDIVLEMDIQFGIN